MDNFGLRTVVERYHHAYDGALSSYRIGIGLEEVENRNSSGSKHGSDK